MPTYQYACSACKHEFEVFQAFSDSSLTHCPECGGELRKVYSAVGVVFKGSGFYKTDSKSTKTASDTAATSTPSAPTSTATSSPSTPNSTPASSSTPITSTSSKSSEAI